MPLANPADNMHSKVAQSFAIQVKKITNGQLVIKTYPSGSLFKGEQIFGAVKNDLVPIGGRLISALSHEDPLLAVDSIPFLATNYREAFRLYRASKAEIDKVLQGKGVKLLYTMPWPAQGMYSSKKLESVEDLSGLRFRPYSAVTQALGAKLGFTAVDIPAAKLSKALRKKQLDVLFGSALTVTELSLHKRFRYWYELRGWLPKEMVVVNLKQWHSMSVVQRQQVSAVAKKIETIGWVRSKEMAQRSKLRLVDAGLEIRQLNSQLQKKFEAAGELLLQQWLIEVGDRGRYLLEKYTRNLR